VNTEAGLDAAQKRTNSAPDRDRTHIPRSSSRLPNLYTELPRLIQHSIGEKLLIR
jgi:hypothetical protein